MITRSQKEDKGREVREKIKVRPKAGEGSTNKEISKKEKREKEEK